MSIEKYLETIVHYASGEKNKEDLLQAREVFFEKLGSVSDKEDDYEEKLRKFLDWYIFDRPMKDTGKPPVHTFFEKFHRTFSKEDEAIYDGFRKSFQSLFIVKKSDEEGIWIKDLISKKKYFVEDEVPKGFFHDEIFQVRLIPYRDGYRFGESFCFHPLAANKVILKKAKKLDCKKPEEIQRFLNDLLQRRQNSERYKHVDALRFYESED